VTQNVDLIKLYSARILALSADIAHLGRLENPQASATRRAPLCGSTVTVDLDLDASGRIVRFAQEVRACALGQAAAGVLGAGILGCTAAQVSQAARQLAQMLAADGPVPDAPFDGFEALLPAREFRNRHESILLALRATEAAVGAATGADREDRAGQPGP
jgi:NifU-like protein involved in Fe-S cluster formation